MRNNLCWYKDVCTLDCPGTCIRYKTMKLLIEQSDLPIAKTYYSQPNKRLDNTNRLSVIKANVDKYVQAGYSCTIISDVVNVTNCGIKLMLSYFDKIWFKSGAEVKGKFVFMPDFFNEIKNFENRVSDSYIRDLNECDLVIFDSLPASMTEFEKKQFELILRHRLLHSKSCIITTNNLDLKIDGVENILLEI